MYCAFVGMSGLVLWFCFVGEGWERRVLTGDRTADERGLAPVQASVGSRVPFVGDL